MPGELRVTVSMADGADDLSPTVLAKLEELRPAGVRLLSGTAATMTLAVRVGLTLVGSHLPAADVEAVHRRAAAALVDVVTHTGVGQKVRAAPAAAALLADDRIVDVALRLGRKGWRTRLSRQPTSSPDARRRGPARSPRTSRSTPDGYEQALGGAAAVAVAVSATVAATPEAGTPPTELAALLTGKLAALVSSLSPARWSTRARCSTALRDDARYQLDPLTLLVRFSLRRQLRRSRDRRRRLHRAVRPDLHRRGGDPALMTAIDSLLELLPPPWTQDPRVGRHGAAGRGRPRTRSRARRTSTDCAAATASTPPTGSVTWRSSSPCSA